jgi:PAS domain S-box-containing protein
MGIKMLSNMTRFESLLEAVPDALVGMDQKGVIRFVNRQSESLFGFDRDDLVGQPIETLVPESCGRSTPSTGRATSQIPGRGPLVWICS